MEANVTRSNAFLDNCDLGQFCRDSHLCFSPGWFNLLFRSDFLAYLRQKAPREPVLFFYKTLQLLFSPSWGQWCASPQMLLFWQACTGRWHSHATLRGSLYGLKTSLVQGSASKGTVLLQRDKSFSHGQLFKEKNSNLASKQAVWLGWVIRKTSSSGTQFTHARCGCLFSKRT